MTTSTVGLALGRVDVDRDAAAVVDDADAAVGQQRDLDVVAVAGQRLVDRVVDDLVDQVVQAALTGRADVHAGALADRLETLEDGDRAGVVPAVRRPPVCRRLLDRRCVLCSATGGGAPQGLTRDGARRPNFAGADHSMTLEFADGADAPGMTFTVYLVGPGLGPVFSRGRRPRVRPTVSPNVSRGPAPRHRARTASEPGAAGSEHRDLAHHALADLRRRAGRAWPGPGASAASPTPSSRARTVEHPVLERLRTRSARRPGRPTTLAPPVRSPRRPAPALTQPRWSSRPLTRRPTELRVARARPGACPLRPGRAVGGRARARPGRKPSRARRRLRPAERLASATWRGRCQLARRSPHGGRRRPDGPAASGPAHVGPAVRGHGSPRRP